MVRMVRLAANDIKLFEITAVSFGKCRVPVCCEALTII